MTNDDLRSAFSQLSTPLKADACLRLGEQLRFGAFLAARAQDQTLSFRAHLRNISGAIEE